MKRFGALSLIVLLLSACGFHLRGMQALPSSLQILGLASDKPYSDLTIATRNTLRGLGIDVVSRDETAPFTLELLTDTVSREVTVISANTQVSEVNLKYSVEFQLRDKSGKVILGPQTVTTQRNFTENTNRILGTYNEYDDTLSFMRRDIINQILARLRAKNSLKALASHSA